VRVLWLSLSFFPSQGRKESSYLVLGCSGVSCSGVNIAKNPHRLSMDIRVVDSLAVSSLDQLFTVVNLSSCKTIVLSRMFPKEAQMRQYSRQ